MVARAVLRDHVSGPALGRALAGLFLVMGAGPVLAPVLGSLLLQVTGWRGVFRAYAALLADSGLVGVVQIVVGGSAAPLVGVFGPGSAAGARGPA
ncbi:MAG: hypothetical protein ACFCVG_07075 [Kineosporiaceae bacterium]